ncbi:autotransporter-associated beta strand repeat-containing protein [Luteolibacter ambystomatis]|uniref:Autotransporter-associated beta strand repeat-containing protein n=1 Tax=Luteolibacter ambystomatis TaxID=2824561 RepID=A0A975G5X8_9BACT|nr:autotransporter-associated beta strand repeat-containing protein [Luteolibacter ambystomatis]QUE49388.1 autotransporter-associated beta strand repeat-containing protein [Luteolibacter ambystomatis]
MKLNRLNGFLRRFVSLLTVPAVVITFLGGAAHGANRYWDGGTVNIAANGDGASGGTAGNWDTTLTNWDQGSGLAHVAWNNASLDSAFFAGTAGTVTLTAPVTAGSLTFTTSGYTLAGTNALTLGGTTATITTSTLNTAGTTTISAPIAGALTGGLTIASNGDMSATGAGASGLGVRLSGTNTFTGDITVTSGLLSYTTDAALGNAANNIILNGGGLLDSSVNQTITRNITVGAAGGIFRTYGAAVATVNGILSGSGAFGRTDGGTVVFNGNNTFTGVFTSNSSCATIFAGSNPATTYNVNGGSIVVGNNGTSGSLASGSVMNLANGTSLFVRRIDAVTATGILPATINIAGATSKFEYNPNSATATMSFDQDFGTDATKGYFRVSGGTLSLASGTDIVVDTVSTGLQTASNVGRLELLSGSTITTRAFNLGETGSNSGVVTQYAGSTATILSGNLGFRLGHWTNGVNPGNVYNLLGGTLDATALAANAGNERFVNIGWDGQADMTVGGGASAALLKASGIQIDANGDTAFNDTLTLSTNGTAEVGALGINSGSVNDRLVLNGGTLRTTADATWSPAITANASTTSVFDTNNFTVTVPSNIGGTGTISLPTNSGSLILTTTGTQTVSAGFADTLTIRKQGAGTTVLSGTSTHTGALTVEAGRLDNTGTLGSTVTVNSGTSIGGEGVFNGDVYFNSGSKFMVDPVTSAAPTFHYVSLSGQPVVSFTSVPVQSQTPITLFNYTGGVIGSIFTDLFLPTLRNPVLTDTGTSVTLSFTNQNLTWNGTTDGQWDVGTSLRWNAGETDAFYTGDAVTFDDTGSNAAVTLAGEILPSSVTVNASTKAYAFGGTGYIGGTGGITKSGTASLTLGTPNTYTGTTTINAGTLVLGNPGALGSSAGATTIASGATLDAGGQDLTSASESITVGGSGVGGAGALVNTGATRCFLPKVTLSSDTTVNIASGKSLAIGQNAGNAAALGTLSLGSNTLIKNGPGDLMLNGVNVTSGNITVNAGSLTLMRGYTTGAGEVNFGQQPTTLAGTGTLTINSGATVTTNRWGAALTISMPITMNGGTLGSTWPGPNGATISSPINLAATSSVNFTGGYGVGTLSGVISGPGTLNTNSDTVILTGANTYTGGTTINGGVLAFNSGSLATTGALTMNGGTLRWNGTHAQDISSRVVMVAAKAAAFDTNANNVTFASPLGTGNTAAITKYGAGTLTIAPVNNYTGGTNVEAGVLSVSAIADGSGSSSIGTTGGTANYVGVNNGSTFQYTGSTNATTTRTLWVDRGAGAIIDIARTGATLTWTPGGGTRSMPLVKTGTGTLLMNGAFTGTATVTVNAGTLGLGGANTYTGATTVNAGGTLLLNSTLTSDISVATGGTLGGEGTSANAITLNEGSTLLANFATPSAQLTTTGAVTVNKTTAGVTLQLQNAPTTAGVQAVPFLKYGTHSGGTTNFNTAAYRSASITDDTTNKILTLNYTSDAKVWAGVAGNTTWDTGTSTDWTGADTKFYSGDNVSFTETATSKAVTLTGTLNPSQMTVNNTSAYTFSGSGTITGNGSLTKTGTGTLNLIQTNGHAYTGGTIISGGMIAVGNNTVNNQAATALGTGTVTINAGGKLGLYPGSTGNVYNIPNNLILNGGTIHQEDGHEHFLGTVSVTADSIVEGRWNPKSVWFDGVVSGTSKITVTDGGNGAWVAFTNPFNSFSGTLALGSSNVNVVAKDNTTLQFATVDSGATTAIFQVAATNAVPNVTVAGLKGTAAAKVINADATARTLTVNNTADNTFAGSIGDGTANGNLLSLVKSGSASLTLGGASTYTGATAVNAGTLIVNAANASSATTVATGATLKGTGTLAGSLAVTGTVAPGNNAVGTLTAASATISGTYACEVNGTNADKLAVTGALTLSPGATLAITATSPTANSYVIATYTGSVPAFTTTTGLPSGFSVDYSTPGQIRLVQSGFTGWVSGFGLSGGDAAVGADPDHDGIPNGVEYVLGGNPATGMDQAKMPTLALVNTDPDGAGSAPAGDYVLFTFRRTSASAAAGVGAGCEFDADLTGTWTTAVGASGVVQNVTPDGFGTGVDKVEVYVPKATWQVAGKLFARLRVTVP